MPISTIYTLNEYLIKRYKEEARQQKRAMNSGR